MKAPKGTLAHLARDGARVTVHVTPGASRNEISDTAQGIVARVAAPPADGRANDSVRRLLARALGVAPGRLTLVQGATARTKTFRLD